MTFPELVEAARNRRAISGFHTFTTRRTMPAVFILNMPGAIIARRLDRMKVYEKRTKANDY